MYVGEKSDVHTKMKGPRVYLPTASILHMYAVVLTYIVRNKTYFLAGVAHSIIRRSKRSPDELAIQTIHVTVIITRVCHGVYGGVYLLGRQVPNAQCIKGEEIQLTGVVRRRGEIDRESEGGPGTRAPHA